MNAPRPSFFSFFSATRTHRFGVKPRRPGEFSGTMLIVIPLTLLIWVYAERAQNRDGSVQTLLGVTIADPKLTATIVDPVESPVTIELNGPQGQIDRLKSTIEATVIDRRLRVALTPADYGLGENKSLDLARLLNANPLFADSGVLVTKTTPAQVRVTVDQLVTREARVAVPTEAFVALLNVSFDPPRVKVSGPMQAIASQFGGADPTVTVDLSSLAKAQRSAGPQRQEMPLTPARDSRITYTPARVQMNFEIGSTIEEFTIPSVGILVVRPVSEDGASRVVIRGSPVIPNVQVRGPGPMIAKYKGDAPEATLKAILEVTNALAGQNELRKEVKFPLLLPGVEVISGPYEVIFDVRELTPDRPR
ncbi:MAG TPA: hypothetical protein VF595_05180 [Tepidisphaeraceae bacterium]|jgi:hypothetical protein